MVEVKHITLSCPYAKCVYKAFVQAVVVDDPVTQKKIDIKAEQKILKELKRGHKDGEHD